MPLPRRFSAVALTLTLALAAGGRAADERLPVPSPEAAEKAEATVRDLFKADFAKVKVADRIALATKLLAQAVDDSNTPDARYALLRAARDTAARAGDATLAFRAADAMAAAFRVGPAAARLPAAGPLAAAAESLAAARAAAEVLVTAADGAAAEEDWDTALKFLAAADTATRKASGAPALQTAVRGRVKQIEAARAEAEQVAGLREKLKANPADPVANLGVGRYLCFTVHRWDDGLPLLAKGEDAKLKDAAAKDLKATAAADPIALSAAADAWYDAAADLQPPAKALAQVRAHRYYAACAGSLTGLNKTKADKRVAELQPVVDAAVDKNKMWVDIRAAVAAKQVKTWDIVGAAFHKETFEEVPPAGAVLIGFKYTTIERGTYPGVVQPIWLTGKGEVNGKVYGAFPFAPAPQVTKAKPGYAVGALTIRGGGGFDAFQPIYMKITDKGLNPADKYDGPKVGGDGGSEGTLGGDGNFIVGLHGRINKKNGHMATMSPISLTTAEGTDPTSTRPKRPKKP